MRNLILLVLCLLGCEPPMMAEEMDDIMARRPQRTYFSRSGSLRVGNTAGGFQFQTSLPYMGVYTVQFNISSPRLAPGGAAINSRPVAKATIDWAVSGNFVRRQIHVADGMSITGTGESVTVSVADNSIIPGGGGPYQPESYDVSVQVSEGGRPGTPNPPFLQEMTIPNGVIINPGAASAIQIPNDIGAHSVYVTVSTTNTTIPPGIFAVQQFALGTIVCGYDPRDFQWVPLVPGATSISIVQGAAGPGPARATVFWGIDG